ncbi:hypothetical protein AOXY_G2818 [Acipenser oxyrinchus oxyrinchus]|uniref:Ig-like domain-containing protein n=1 Tax=Acipenser oxyrinchus oxyrinchus TaxID=40147 RepID=A0AAD8GJC7_ACIOX|nr:hypothetical protein AOXY_G2818 [Acipenser oxyrinchus oxyrinchus]
MTWIFFLISFTIVVQVTSEVPEVPEIAVYLRDAVSLPGVKGNQTRLIEWTFKNSSGYSEDVFTLYLSSPDSPDIFAKYKKRIYVFPNGSFTLTHVDWRDGGNYERKIDQKHKQQYRLRILELPGHPSIIKNQDVLTCNATGYDSMTWTKDGKNVPEDFEISNNTLQLPSNASVSKLCGVYKCQAQSPKHNKTAHVLIIVFSDQQKAIVVTEMCAFVLDLLSVSSKTMQFQFFYNLIPTGYGPLNWWLFIGVVADFVSPILNIVGLSLWIHEDNNFRTLVILMVIAVALLILLTIRKIRQVKLPLPNGVLNIFQYGTTLSVIFLNIYKENPCSFFMKEGLPYFLALVVLIVLLWASTLVYLVAAGKRKYTRTAEDEDKNEPLHREDSVL